MFLQHFQYNGNEYLELGNVPKQEAEHVKAVSELLKTPIELIDNAQDADGNPLPNYYQVAVLLEKCENGDIFFDIYVETSLRLSEKYATHLKTLGFPVDEIFIKEGKTCYLGCEKDFWPELMEEYCQYGRIRSD